MKRVHFLLEKDALYEENKEYLDMFCLTFRMVPMLRSLSIEKQYTYNLLARRVFLEFFETRPDANISVEEGMQMIECMRLEQPGAVSFFVKRIFPHRFLKDAFAELHANIHSSFCDV